MNLNLFKNKGITACDSNPCLNNGTCTYFESSSTFSCYCASNYVGARCERCRLHLLFIFMQNNLTFKFCKTKKALTADLIVINIFSSFNVFKLFSQIFLILFF